MVRGTTRTVMTDEEDADTEDDGGESDENSPDVGRL